MRGSWEEIALAVLEALLRHVFDGTAEKTSDVLWQVIHLIAEDPMRILATVPSPRISGCFTPPFLHQS